MRFVKFCPKCGQEGRKRKIELSPGYVIETYDTTQEFCECGTRMRNVLTRPQKGKKD